MTKKSYKLPFKSSDPEVQRFFEKLAAENSKLHSQLAQCRAKNISLSNQIEALKKQHERDKRQSIYDLSKTLAEIEKDNIRERKAAQKNNSFDKLSRAGLRETDCQFQASPPLKSKKPNGSLM